MSVSVCVHVCDCVCVYICVYVRTRAYVCVCVTHTGNNDRALIIETMAVEIKVYAVSIKCVEGLKYVPRSKSRLIRSQL